MRACASLLLGLATKSQRYPSLSPPPPPGVFFFKVIYHETWPEHKLLVLVPFFVTTGAEFIITVVWACTQKASAEAFSTGTVFFILSLVFAYLALRLPRLEAVEYSRMFIGNPRVAVGINVALFLLLGSRAVFNFLTAANVVDVPILTPNWKQNIEVLVIYAIWEILPVALLLLTVARGAKGAPSVYHKPRFGLWNQMAMDNVVDSDDGGAGGGLDTPSSIGINGTPLLRGDNRRVVSGPAANAGGGHDFRPGPLQDGRGYSRRDRRSGWPGSLTESSLPSPFLESWAMTDPHAGVLGSSQPSEDMRYYDGYGGDPGSFGMAGMPVPPGYGRAAGGVGGGGGGGPWAVPGGPGAMEYQAPQFFNVAQLHGNGYEHLPVVRDPHGRIQPSSHAGVRMHVSPPGFGAGAGVGPVAAAGPVPPPSAPGGAPPTTALRFGSGAPSRPGRAAPTAGTESGTTVGAAHVDGGGPMPAPPPLATVMESPRFTRSQDSPLSGRSQEVFGQDSLLSNPTRYDTPPSDEQSRLVSSAQRRPPKLDLQAT